MVNGHPLQLPVQLENHLALDSPWKPKLDEPLRRQAQEVVLLIAERLRDPDAVQQIAHLIRTQSSFPCSWDLSPSWASAELALFYHYVACSFPESCWQTTAQRYLKLIATSSQQHGLSSLALFGGISGIAFVIQHFSEAGRYYQQTLSRLHHSIAEQVRKRSCWHLPIERDIVESDFDVLVGASGLVGYLANTPTPDSVVQEALSLLLSYLLTLTKPGQILGQECWLCPSSFLETEEGREYSPYGRFNCGLAHGIAGPLAALSLAALRGYDVPGLHDSIAYISTWLMDHHFVDRWGMTWPTVIPYEVASSPERWSALPAARTAWCYGAPGIARSLWLAGHALDDHDLKGKALDALKAVLCRPCSVRQIDAPTLCHGTAGLLLICLHFAHESQECWLLEQIPHLVEQILAQFDPQSPLGFRDIEPGGALVDQPAFLTGAPGTALALLAAASDVVPSWDRLLLLS